MAVVWEDPFFFPLFRATSTAHGGSQLGVGIQLELQPPAYTTVTATPDLSRVCDPHRRSRQRRIPNPLSQARDRTLNLMAPRRPDSAAPRPLGRPVLNLQKSGPGLLLFCTDMQSALLQFPAPQISPEFLVLPHAIFRLQALLREQSFPVPLGEARETLSAPLEGQIWPYENNVKHKWKRTFSKSRCLKLCRLLLTFCSSHARL